MHVNWTIYRAISVNTNYEVSIHGLVRNRKTKRILKAWITGAGYEMVTLCKDGVQIDYFVHRLVAEAFIDNKGLSEINHKDERKTNNYYGNLEYCTHKYNCNYGTGQQRRLESYAQNRREAQCTTRT